MRDDLLSIGELARMKGVSVKSLRYYDRLGIFRPVLVDPSSGYRYYSLNQLMDLDAITTCIELGIPLKELKAYIEPSGMLDLASLIERGRRQALVRIADARAVLAQVNVQLREINEQSAFATGSSPYVRKLGRKTVLCRYWGAAAFDVRDYARWMTCAYEEAKHFGVVPSYLQGFMFESGGAGDEMRAFAYLEVLPMPEVDEEGRLAPANAELALQGAAEGDVSARVIAGGTYLGRRLTGESLAACFDEAFAIAREQGRRAVATEVWDERLDPSTYVVEMLVERDR